MEAFVWVDRQTGHTTECRQLIAYPCLKTVADLLARFLGHSKFSKNPFYGYYNSDRLPTASKEAAPGRPDLCACVRQRVFWSSADLPEPYIRSSMRRQITD